MRSIWNMDPCFRYGLSLFGKTLEVFKKAKKEIEKAKEEMEKAGVKEITEVSEIEKHYPMANTYWSCRVMVFKRK